MCIGGEVGGFKHLHVNKKNKTTQQSFMDFPCRQDVDYKRQ